MFLKIGLTGGIGSGKTTVARIFEIMDIPVYYADKEAKKLMNEDSELINNIRENFGDESYSEGELNREFVSSVVFSNKEKLQLLNSYVHPAVLKHGEGWMKKQTSPYAIHEAALIFEAGVHARLDFVIGVFAPNALRIKRVMERDHISREDVTKRMDQQIEEDIKMKLCDFIITNDEQHLLIPQVMEVHEKILANTRK